MLRVKPDRRVLKAIKLMCVSVLLLAGCALQEKGQWVKPGFTEAQWKRDRYECTQESTYQPDPMPYPGYYSCIYRRSCPWYYVPTGPVVDPYRYNLCLEARGYEWRPEGEQ